MSLKDASVPVAIIAHFQGYSGQAGSLTPYTTGTVATADVLSGIVLADTTSSVAITYPTGSALVSGDPGLSIVGRTFKTTLVNKGGNSAVITAGTDTSFWVSGSATVTTNISRTFTYVLTALPHTFVIYAS